MRKNKINEGNSGMRAAKSDKGNRFFRCLELFIRLNWCADFGRSFSCNNTWLFMR